MDDITRERVWRKLQVLPDAQLFQVLDYIEFLEAKYAPRRATEPTGIQRFAERLQDRLRGRSVAPEYITGAVGILGMARRAVETGREVVSGVVQTGLGVVDEVVEAGRELLSEPAPAHPGEATLPPGVVVKDGTPILPMAEVPAGTDLPAAVEAPAPDLAGAVEAAAPDLPPGVQPPAPEPPDAPPGREAVTGESQA